MRYSAVAVLVAVLVVSVSAQPPAPEPDPIPLPLPAPMPNAIPLKAPKAIEQPKPEEVAAIAKLMREMVLQKMPDPLVKSKNGWGKQKEYAVGRVMLRDPKKLPDAPREMVNDGLWRRFTVTARDPAETLAVSIPELTRPEENKLLITIDAAMDINFRMEQQLWKRGLQLYSGETRGHCKGAVQLKATVAHTLEFKPGSLLPDVVLKITVTDAKLFYEKLVIDHTAGLDGEDAKRVGEIVVDLVKSAKPDLEKQLLEKANAAILKAAGTKEVKVKLDKLMSAGVVPKK
jgi:hypothetical protein